MYCMYLILIVILVFHGPLEAQNSIARLRIFSISISFLYTEAFDPVRNFYVYCTVDHFDLLLLEVKL